MLASVEVRLKELQPPKIPSPQDLAPLGISSTSARSPLSIHTTIGTDLWIHRSAPAIPQASLTGISSTSTRSPFSRLAWMRLDWSRCSFSCCVKKCGGRCGSVCLDWSHRRCSPVVWIDALNVHSRGSSGCKTLTLTLTLALAPPHLF